MTPSLTLLPPLSIAITPTILAYFEETAQDDARAKAIGDDDRFG